MDSKERGQWKLVFNKDASRVMTMGGRRSAEMLQQDIEAFVSWGMNWDPARSKAWLTCTSAQRNEKGVLKACLHFNSAELAIIEARAKRQDKSVSDFIAERVESAISSSNTRNWGEGCAVRVNPIQHVTP